MGVMGHNREESLFNSIRERKEGQLLPIIKTKDMLCCPKTASEVLGA